MHTKLKTRKWSAQRMKKFLQSVTYANQLQPHDIIAVRSDKDPYGFWLAEVQAQAPDLKLRQQITVRWYDRFCAQLFTRLDETHIQQVHIESLIVLPPGFKLELTITPGRDLYLRGRVTLTRASLRMILTTGERVTI